jgi:RNA polymerase sigma-B factor
MDAARDEPGSRAAARGPSDRELAQAVQSLPRDDPRRDAALTELVARYQSLVRACVHRYRSSPEATDDLMQAGYLGLLKAISRFDTEIGDSLAAYAQPAITGELKRHFRDKRWQVHVRRSTQEPFQASSMDTPLSAEADSASLGEDGPGFEPSLDMEAVWNHLPELPEREQRLLMMRFYGNMTQSQIAGKLGLSQMHVSRLLSHALGHLRERINGPGRPPEPTPVIP